MYVCLYQFRSAKQLERRITELSLTHGILSPFTAFVGVEESRSTKDAHRSQIRNVPVQISRGDEHLLFSAADNNQRFVIIISVIYHHAHAGKVLFYRKRLISIRITRDGGQQIACDFFCLLSEISPPLQP